MLKPEQGHEISRLQNDRGPGTIEMNTYLTPSSNSITGYRGFTVPELLISAACVFLLATTLTWQLLDQWAAVRRQRCQSNIRSIGVAVNDFQTAQNQYPRHMDVQLVPYLSAEPNTPLRKGQRPKLGSLRCPTDELGIALPYAFNYAWNAGPGFCDAGHGFVPADLAPPLTTSDFPDGISHTAAASETLIFDMDSSETRRKLWSIGRKYPRRDQKHCSLDDRPHFLADCLNVPMDDDHMSYSHRGSEAGQSEWYFHLMTPNQPSCESSGVSEPVIVEVFAANSAHPGGVFLLLVDGSVRFISDGIDPEVWTALSTRDGMEKINW